MASLGLRFRNTTARRRIISSVVVLVVALLIGGSAYAYRLIDAIVDSERTTVVDLPPRDPGLGSLFDDQTRTPAGATHTPTVQPTATATLEDEDSEAPAPTATLTPVDIQADVTVTAGPSSTPQLTPSPEPTSTATSVSPSPSATTVLPTATVGPRLPTNDDPSHFDVLGNLIDLAGDGDPARSEVWGGVTELNILLLGVDKRPDGGDQNADVIIIAHLDLIERKVSAVSIPRDLYVAIPIGDNETVSDKINSAYNYGYRANPTNEAAGVAMMRDTLYYNFEVQIDGYVMVDFDGFTEVVDSMGGVDITVETALLDPAYPTEDYGTKTVIFSPGPQHMDGERALEYVRTRHQGSDDGRRERQLQLLRALFAEAKSFDSVTNGYEIINALGDSVQTSFSLKQQLTLAKLGYEMADSDIDMVTMAEPLIAGQFISTGAWVYLGDPLELRNWVHENLETDFEIAPTSLEATPDSTPLSSPAASGSVVPFSPTGTPYVPQITVGSVTVTPTRSALSLPTPTTFP